MSTLPKHFFTPEEYLELERKAEYKSEYYQGETFAMSGASRRHNRVRSRLTSLVEHHLRRGPSEVYESDMRVLEPSGLYTYPDMVVACGEPRFADNSFDTLLNPTLIVEILSPSTETFDRGKKSVWYRSIPPLREYLILWQDTPELTLYRREADGTWTVRDAAGMDSAVELASIGYTLQLRDLYEGIVEAEGTAV